MGNDVRFPLQLQGSLRFCFGWTFVSPILAVLLFIFDNQLWTAAVGCFASSFFVGLTLNQRYGSDLRKWWFLWRGPFQLIPLDKDQKEVEAWLAETYQDRYAIPYPYVVKFKHARDAVAYKLTWG